MVKIINNILLFRAIFTKKDILTIYINNLANSILKKEADNLCFFTLKIYSNISIKGNIGR